MITNVCRTLVTYNPNPCCSIRAAWGLKPYNRCNFYFPFKDFQYKLVTSGVPQPVRPLNIVCLACIQARVFGFCLTAPLWAQPHGKGYWNPYLCPTFVRIISNFKSDVKKIFLWSTHMKNTTNTCRWLQYKLFSLTIDFIITYMKKLHASDQLKNECKVETRVQVTNSARTLPKFTSVFTFCDVFACTLKKKVTTWFLVQFGVISSCKFFKDFCCLWKIYSCSFSPNCTQNHVITYKSVSGSDHSTNSTFRSN